MKVIIVSPEKTLYSGEVDVLEVPGESGRFEVMKNHAPIISSLVAGTVVCKGSNPYSLDISSGFIEVAHNEIAVCVEI